MKELFAEILNMSISAGILIAVCIVIRVLFKNMPKFVRCLMWLLVAVRLVIPFSIESPFSMLPKKDYVTVSVTQGEVGNSEYYTAITVNPSSAAQEAGMKYVREENGETKEVNTHSDMKTTAAAIGLMDILSIVWVVGAGVVMIYALAAYIRLRHMIGDAVKLRGNIYQSEKVGSAFVLGIISPKIYIPYGLDINELFMVVNHEKAHIKRKDHFVKPLGFIITAVYWFNPFVWIAYILLCKDIELACDEKVIKRIGYDKKKAYSQTLLNLSIPRKYITACPVAFGELGVSERVRNVLKMRKGRKIILVAALGVCGILALGFLTYPRSSAEEKKAIAADKLEQEIKSENISGFENAEKPVESEPDIRADFVAEEENNSSEKTPLRETIILEEGDSGASSKEPRYVFYYNDYDNDGITNIYINTEDLVNPDEPHFVNLGDNKVVGIKTDDPNKYYSCKPGEVYSIVFWPVLSDGVMEKHLNYSKDGTNIVTNADVKVVSVNDGTVIDMGLNDDNVAYITIKGDNGLTYTYDGLDNDAVSVMVGDKVQAGDVISKLYSYDSSKEAVLNFKICDEYGMNMEPVMAEIP